MTENATTLGTTAVLSVGDIRVKFGGLTVLNGVSFQVEPGEILGLVGPNGAGKSTAINVVSGFTRERSGSVRFEGHRQAAQCPACATRRGRRLVGPTTLDPPS